MFQVSTSAWTWQAVVGRINKILLPTFTVSKHEMPPVSFLKCPDLPEFEKRTSSPPVRVGMVIQVNILLLPLWLKSPSISIEDLECAIQSMEQGTMPSWAGQRSVVRTRHQSGLSWSRSRTSTVWPRRTVSSPLLPPLLATKSWITTVNSQPPESWNGGRTGVKNLLMYFLFVLYLISTVHMATKNENSLLGTLCEVKSYPASFRTETLNIHWISYDCHPVCTDYQHRGLSGVACLWAPL